MKSFAPRALAALTIAMTALLPVLFTAPAAQAADIYKYWGYFTVADGEFVYATTGPGAATPADGSTEAYRYAAPADFNKPNLPRANLTVVTFDAVCADSTADADEKRVAVLVDYGLDSDASKGETTPAPAAACAVVAEDATGLQVLQAAFGDVRTEDSSAGPSVCGISGYPATGCLGTKVETGTPPDTQPVEFAIAGDDTADTSTDSQSSDDGGNNAALLAVSGVVIVLVVVGALLLQRRRRSA
jgi:hypothetical protein